MCKAYLPLVVGALLLAGTALARPQFAHQAKPTLLGLAHQYDHVVVGRFIKAEGQGGQRKGTLVCDQVLKGDHEAQDQIIIPAYAMTWRSFSDEDKQVVVFFNTTVTRSTGSGEGIGRKAAAIKRLTAAIEAAAEKPVGTVHGIGIHLEDPQIDRQGLSFKWHATNLTTVPWTVLVDRKVAIGRNAPHRGIALRVIDVEQESIDKQSNEPKTIANAGVVYQSQRPWHGRAVIETAKNKTRPDRPARGATVRLTSGSAFTGRLDLRPVRGQPGAYRVVINGHADLGDPVRLTAGRAYRFAVTHDNDYHYYTGNGARLGVSDMLWGSATSNSVVVKLPKADPE